MRLTPLSFGLAALVLAGPLACGSPPPPAAPTPAPTASVAATPVVATSPAYDLSPVAEPPDLVGLVRWKSPGATVAAVGGCAGAPTQLTGVVTVAFLESMFKDILHGQVEPKKLAQAVATDAPIDLVVALDADSRRGEPIFAFSIGLSSIDGAKAAITGEGPAEVVPGVWRIGDPKARRDLTCVVAASAGATPARLVCGHREKWITALVPYITRTLPTTAPAATDIHGEARYAPVDARYGNMLRGYAQGLPVIAKSQASIGDKTFDTALNDAAGALSDEAVALTHDLDKVTLDIASGSASSCLTVTGALKLRDKSSWLAGTLLDRPERAGPAPAIFWRAPKDASSVSFGRANDPARFAGMTKTIRAMIEGALGKFQIGSADDRKALADLFTITVNKDTNSVTASGQSTPAAAPVAAAKAPAKPGPAQPAPGARPSAQQHVDEVLNGLGWTVIGLDQASDSIGKWLKDVVAVYNRKGLTDPLKKALGSESRFLPTIKVGAAPASLGKGSFDIEIKGDFALHAPPTAPKLKVAGPPGGGGKKAPPPPPPPKAGPPEKPEKITFSLHILLMADGNNTWIAFGASKDELVRHLLMVKTGAPDSDTLAARAGLEPLRSEKSMSGGFFTLAAFSKLLRLGDRGGLDGLRETRSPFVGAPHGGTTPIFFTTNDIPDNTGGRAELTLKLSKDTLEDLVALLALKRTDSGDRDGPGPAQIVE